MSYLLEVRNLRKQFGDLTAVDDISFGIPAGICFGLLGPNGAGKTTTIEIIEGITRADGGDILYHGRPRDNAFSQKVGIQFQSTSLMDSLSVDEVIDLFASLYPQNADKEELIRLCDLSGFRSRVANRLSGGQKQRLLLALALINDPELVFLDEPTTGLDPQARRNFWHLIMQIKQRGKTIVLTTHYMDEAESLCDDLIIMDHGRIIDRGSPQALLARHLPHNCVCLDRSVDGIDFTRVDGEIVEATDQLEIHTRNVEQTLQELIAQHVDLSSLRVRSPTLEDLFIQLTGHTLRE